MSVEAISWALKQPIENSSTKFVLVVMANCAGPDGACWPSLAYISESTGQNIKTVVANMKRLRNDGWLIDTGKRTGETGRVIRYKLNFNRIENGCIQSTQKRNDSESGIVPKTGVLNSTENGCIEGGNIPKNGVEIYPKTGIGTVSEPSVNQNTIHATCVRTSRPPGPDENQETGKPEKQKSESRTLKTFLEACHADGLQPVPADDPIFDYADKVGICDEMLLTAWTEFKARFLPTAKRQKDWRAHYRNAVRRNWFGLWFIRDGSEAKWTTAGEQARRENMQ